MEFRVSAATIFLDYAAKFNIVALASDDPGIFSNIGLSFDFFQVRGSPIALLTLTFI
jgi:hypothetical protein